MQRLGFQTADGPWELRKLARENLLTGRDAVKTCVTGGGGTDMGYDPEMGTNARELEVYVELGMKPTEQNGQPKP